jgi:hypothetical protein
MEKQRPNNTHATPPMPHRRVQNRRRETHTKTPGSGLVEETCVRLHCASFANSGRFDDCWYKNKVYSKNRAQPLQQPSAGSLRCWLYPAPSDGVLRAEVSSDRSQQLSSSCLLALSSASPFVRPSARTACGRAQLPTPMNCACRALQHDSMVSSTGLSFSLTLSPFPSQVHLKRTLMEIP